ncbi:unnamed protein product [Closterium sp. NIES-65]|nr:unnamed protein product [Closterium sp. NIES-65]
MPGCARFLVMTHGRAMLVDASGALVRLCTESGFSLQVKPFFNNFGAIVTFSCLGTFLSAIVTGILVYAGGFLFLMYKLSFLEALIFGSLISSTDPVAVLAIFQDVGADTNLYALVFGESVLNDAVAITMYRSQPISATSQFLPPLQLHRTVMTIIRNPAADPSISAAFQYAAITFAGSTSIGISISFLLPHIRGCFKRLLTFPSPFPFPVLPHLCLTSSNFALTSSNFALPSSNFALPSSNFALPSSNFALPSSNFALPSSNFALPSSNFALPSSNFALPSSNFALPSSNFALPSSNFALPSSNFALPSSNFALPFSTFPLQV